MKVSSTGLQLCRLQITPLPDKPSWTVTEPPKVELSGPFFKDFSPLSLLPDKEVPTAVPSARSPVATPGSTKENSPKAKTSGALAGGLLHTVLTQKGRLVSQKGDILPSSLPQNLLPLLGRGLSVSSPEREGGGLLRRVKPPASAAASGPGSDPTEPPPTDTHSLPPHTQTHTPELEAEITTVGTVPDVDTETGTPPPALSSCMVNFSDPEGYIDSSDDPPLPDTTYLHCTYTVTVYTGYGVELQVETSSVNLSEGEQLSIRGADERGALLVLANHTLLVEGQVIRSPTNTLSVYYRSALDGNVGFFQLHYQSESAKHTNIEYLHMHKHTV
uniref:CUB domain-containing protein n=1 Tax=Labrus bergylta TaxID=56723 RepID=A0A3Q3F289_9LABR